MLIDMHVNAKDDDGEARDPRRILDEVTNAGLDGLLVVGRTGDLDEGTWSAARQKNDPLVFFGVPVTTARAHFVCIPEKDAVDLVPDKWLTSEDGVDESELLDRMTEKGAAVFATQPYERDTPPVAGDDVFGFDGIHALEVRTSHSDPMAADLAIEAGLGMCVPCLAGSASRRDDPQIGIHATLFATKFATQSEFVSALRKGDAWPVLIDRPSSRSKKRRRRRR